MYKAYVIQSLLNKRYYIGHTKNLDRRLEQHNSGKVRSTKSGMPWKLIYIEEFESKSEAYKRELQIKSYKGGRAFKNIINN
ncbi:MAG: GIY-YIG nuclease family protein [Candidatus Parcubacteria bacterium]|nr:GIY-YIG nuclease family protein [Candidatus Parcubacteria bacterium]